MASPSTLVPANSPITNGKTVTSIYKNGKTPLSPGESCPHAVNLSEPSATFCKHCSKKFCKTCILNHMELLKREINLISNGYRDRIEKTRLIWRHIEENVREIHEAIAATSDPLVEAFRAAVVENSMQLSHKAAQLGEDLASRLFAGDEVQLGEIDQRLRDINDMPTLFSSYFSDFVHLYEMVIEQDKKVSKLDQIEQVAKSNITFSFDYSLVGIMRDLLGKFSDLELETPPESDQGSLESDSNFDVRELHRVVKSRDLAKLQAILQNNTFTTAFRRFLIEHRDEADKQRTALLQAANLGWLEAVKTLVIEHGANQLASDETGDMAIHLAARSSYNEVVKFLLDSKKAFVNAKGCDDESVLVIASGLGNLDLVRYLVDDLKADFEQPESECGWTPLIYAASEGHLNVIKFLADRGADLFARDSICGDSALNVAAYSGQVEVVEFLLEKNPDSVDLTSSDCNRTPLCLASQMGHLEIVDYLVSFRHANLEHSDKDGNTPLLLAAKAGSLDVVEYLLEKEANLWASGSNGETILHRTGTSGNVELAQFLLGQYPDLLEVRDGQNATVMHYACSANELGMVKCLVEQYGAKIDVEDDSGATPLFDAVENSGGLALVRYLVEKGAVLDRCDFDGKTVLHYALKSKDVQLIAFLVELEPKLIHLPNNKGETPSQAAKRYGMSDLVLDLLEQRAITV